MWPRSPIHSSSGGTSESCSNWARVRLLFLSGTRSILHPYLNMRMGFIVLEKGIFFGDLKFLQNKAFLVGHERLFSFASPDANQRNAQVVGQKPDRVQNDPLFAERASQMEWISSITSMRTSSCRAVTRVRCRKVVTPWCAGRTQPMLTSSSS